MSKVFETTAYDKFVKSKENRVVGNNSKLRKSFEQNGFLNIPILVEQTPEGKLKILDGQHRFAYASELGLPVKYVIHSGGHISIPQLNSTSRRWSPSDYLSSFVDQGKPEYIKLKDFVTKYGIPVNHAAKLMCGNFGVGMGNVELGFKEGTYKPTAERFANEVGDIVLAVSNHITFARTGTFVDSIARCMLVPEFDPKRLIHVIQKNPRAFKSQASVDQMLSVIEENYNNAYRNPIPLKFLAQNAVRSKADTARLEASHKAARNRTARALAKAQQ